jgi:hypothetical protein
MTNFQQYMQMQILVAMRFARIYGLDHIEAVELIAPRFRQRHGIGT